MSCNKCKNTFLLVLIEYSSILNLRILNTWNIFTYRKSKTGINNFNFKTIVVFYSNSQEKN